MEQEEFCFSLGQVYVSKRNFKSVSEKNMWPRMRKLLSLVDILSYKWNTDPPSSKYTRCKILTFKLIKTPSFCYLMQLSSAFLNQNISVTFSSNLWIITLTVEISNRTHKLDLVGTVLNPNHCGFFPWQPIFPELFLSTQLGHAYNLQGNSFWVFPRQTFIKTTETGDVSRNVCGIYFSLVVDGLICNQNSSKMAKSNV